MFIIDYKLFRYIKLPSHCAEGRLLNVEHRLVKQWVEITPHWFLAKVDGICTEVTLAKH